MSTQTHESGTPRPAAGAPPAPAPSTLRRAHPPRRVRAGRDEPTLAELAWTLAERRWTVASVACAAVLGAAAYLFIAQPVYESSVLVQVEGRAKPAAPDAVVQLFDTNPPGEAEMRILRSRPLLESVVDELGLDVEAQPRRFPVVGSGLARRRAGAPPAPAPLGLTRYGWGGERIQVKRLEVSDALVGEPLVLAAFEDGGYEVRTPEGAVLVTGEVGAEATGGDGDRRITLLVSELTARPETEFTLRKLRRVEVVDRIQKALVVTEQGRAAGLAEVRLTGSDPALIAKILDALAATYVRQSLERTSAEAASMLRVLERRLATLKSGADAAELAMTRFHERNGKINLSVDARRLLARLADLDRAITEAELADSDLTRRHTARYPEAVSPADRAEQLRPQRAELEAQVMALPGLELEYARLSRQIGLTTERYGRLLERVEELRAAKSGWLGNARVMERAVEGRKPVSPKAGLVVAAGVLLGLLGGIAAALVRGAFDDGIRDPDEVETRTGLPVFATIPRSAAQRRIARRGSRRGRLEALSVVDPGDGAVEELRALRTGVEFALRRATSNVVAVGSPAPRAGKSFVSVNLAHLLAASGGRVLLVDCDLRRGILHRYFGLEVQPGISDVLRGEATLDAALRRTADANVDLLPAGARVSNPAELLAGAPFERLLDEMRGRYAIVVVDTPPILSVTDSALVARYAGVSLLVLRAREQNTREVALAVKRLVRNGVSVRGAVLNDVRPTLGRYGRSGRYRRYETRSA